MDNSSSTSSSSTSKQQRLGPRDKRLQVRRCLQCRTAHRKCDETRPCSACQIRRIACTDGRRNANKHGSPMVFMNMTVSPPPREPVRPSVSHQAAISERETPQSHRIALDGLSEFIGHAKQLPEPLQVLSSDYLWRVIESNDHVSAAAIAVGAAFRIHSNSLTDDNKNEDLQSVAESAYGSARRSLENLIAVKLSEPSAADVLCALLLHIYHLMVDESTMQLINMKEQIFQPLFIQYARGPHFSSSDRPLFRLFWVFELLHAENFDQGTFLAEDEWVDRLNASLNPGQKDYLGEAPRPMSRIGEIMDSLIIQLARMIELSARSASWRNKTRDGTVYPPLREEIKPIVAISNDASQTDEDEIETQRLHCLNAGLSLFESLETLRTEIASVIDDWKVENSEQNFSGTAPSADSGTLCLLKVYAGTGRLSLNRLFSDPLWTSSEHSSDDDQSSLGTTRLDIDPEEFNQLAYDTLALIEQRLAPVKYESGSQRVPLFTVGLEAVLYLPAVIILSLEIRCVTLRSRVTGMFEAIKDRGFVAAAAVSIEDIDLAWQNTAPGCGELCICNVTNNHLSKS